MFRVRCAANHGLDLPHFHQAVCARVRVELGGVRIEQRQAVTQLKHVPAMRVYERVTSDTARGPGTPHQIPVSGARFLSVEPYAGGVATVAALAAGAGGEVGERLSRLRE